jgi:hypothetical protein
MEETTKVQELTAKARVYYENAKDKGKMQFHMKWAEQIWPRAFQKYSNDTKYGEKVRAINNSLELLDKPTGMEILGRIGYPIFDMLDIQGKRNEELIGPVIDAWYEELG